MPTSQPGAGTSCLLIIAIIVFNLTLLAAAVWVVASVAKAVFA